MLVFKENVYGFVYDSQYGNVTQIFKTPLSEETINIIEESIDERNSMQKPYRYYTAEEAFTPISEYEMKVACKEREKLQKKHFNNSINLIRNFVSILLYFPQALSAHFPL